MASNYANPEIVPSSRFHHYVPAVTSLHIPKEKWNGTGLNLYEFSGDNDGSVEPPAKSDFGMAFLINGHIKANYRLNSSKWAPMNVQPNTGFLVRPGSILNWQWRNKDAGDLRPQAVNVILDTGLIYKTALECLDLDSSSIELPNTMAIQDMLLSSISIELLNEANNQSLLGKIYVETLSQLMIIRLLNRHIRIRLGIKTGKGGLPRHLQNRIGDYINENLAGDISINVLATLAGLSSYHFIRMFNRSFGVPPHQYVLTRRIEKAKQLLTYSALSMTQVALEVGYQSHSHFSNAFRRFTGYTPSQFRKIHL